MTTIIANKKLNWQLMDQGIGGLHQDQHFFLWLPNMQLFLFPRHDLEAKVSDVFKYVLYY